MTKNKIKTYSKLFDIVELSGLIYEETRGQVHNFFDMIINKKEDTFTDKKIKSNLKLCKSLHKIKKIDVHQYFFSKKEIHNMIIIYASENKKTLNLDVIHDNKFMNEDLLLQYEDQIYECINLYLYNIWYHIKDVEKICPNPRKWTMLMYSKRVNPSHVYCLEHVLYAKITKKYHKYKYDE
jgi:hypothetical protein